MTEEITINKIPVVMKNGITHWITNESGEKLQMALQMQTSHSFIKIKELGITINTAEISGIYTPKQYDEILKIKQGMWQCKLGKWHGKKEICECVKEEARIRKEEAIKAEQEKINREKTPEEIERIRKGMEQIREKLKQIAQEKKIDRF